jgi:hypothetical protein
MPAGSARGKQRVRCECGSYATSGCKKCGRKPSAGHAETVEAVRRWAERQRTLGLVNPLEWSVLARMMDDVFGERL